MRRTRKWTTEQLRKPCTVRALGPQSLWLPAACKEAEVINIPLLALPVRQPAWVRCRERREVVSVFSLASYLLSVENMVYNRLPAWHLQRKPGERCLLTVSAIPGGESLTFPAPLHGFPESVCLLQPYSRLSLFCFCLSPQNSFTYLTILNPLIYCLFISVWCVECLFISHSCI